MARFKLTVIKSMTYRGAPEEYSNTYGLKGTVPTSGAEWRTLFDAIVAGEKTVYSSGVTVVRGYGYADDDPDTVAGWTVDLTAAPDTPVPGTLSVSGAIPLPGDDAFWARWKTSRLSEKGKPVYLRKYWHQAYVNSSTGGGTLWPAQRTAALAFAALMYGGTLPGGATITATAYKKDGVTIPGHDDTILSHSASTYVTTRTLKRRGKRPGG